MQSLINRIFLSIIILINIGLCSDKIEIASNNHRYYFTYQNKYIVPLSPKLDEFTYVFNQSENKTMLNSSLNSIRKDLDQFLIMDRIGGGSMVLAFTLLPPYLIGERELKGNNLQVDEIIGLSLLLIGTYAINTAKSLFIDEKLCQLIATYNGTSYTAGHYDPYNPFRNASTEIIYGFVDNDPIYSSIINGSILYFLYGVSKKPRVLSLSMLVFSVAASNSSLDGGRLGTICMASFLYNFVIPDNTDRDLVFASNLALFWLIDKVLPKKSTNLIPDDQILKVNLELTPIESKIVWNFNF